MVAAEDVLTIDLPAEFQHVSAGRLEIARIDDVPAAANEFLAIGEFEEWQRLGHPGRSAEWLAARICLKKLVSDRGGISDWRAVSVVKDNRGRPRLSLPSAVRRDVELGDCSLAHSGPWAVAAWTPRPQERIGIDIECISPRLHRVAGLFVSPRDRAAVVRPETRQLAIWWCLKEACSKACGLGLGAGFAEMVCTETRVHDHFVLYDRGDGCQGWHAEFEGFIVAVCVRQPSA